MPGERRAFHARRKLAHTGKNHKLAQVVGVSRFPHHEVAEALENRLDLLDRFALEALGHDGRRGLRDRAARALEAQILHAPVLDPEVNLHFVAAERVVAVRAAVRVFELLEVTRPLVVVQDRLLVTIAQIGYQPNTSRTLTIGAASVSISSFVL